MLPFDREANYMEQSYWLERERASLANARATTNAKARLIHYELAGRYSVKAANAGNVQPQGAITNLNASVLPRRPRQAFLFRRQQCEPSNRP